ncbi:two-component system regulatory protein YycI [Caminicella sporogenes]|uniref:two-component system regulatory protein YycI n=1 Tax=Caminicella sporogenes TaxID=166485 RepID=UPI00253FC333|nr:two-component system regulatory protein YycI [Caminicella sporogenes]WIF95820.1 two-component system regulatory protein YycI [Caminicella sporogenes]
MDWNKAKNILIIAFIITNVFLFYHIFKELNENFFYSVKDETIQDVKKVLRERDIVVKANVPKRVPNLPILKVRYERFNGGNLAKKILGNYKQTDNKYFNSDRNEMIEVSCNNKLFTYEKKLMTSNVKAISLEEAKKIADKFIKKYGFYNDNVKYWDTKIKNNGEYEVIYKQIYNGRFLDDMDNDEQENTSLGMKVLVNNTGVIKFTKKWLISDGAKSYAKRVIPSTKALLMAIEKIRDIIPEGETAVITDISLGYCLDVYGFDTFIDDKWYEMESFYASPYWRICLKDKKCIYITAYE